MAASDCYAGGLTVPSPLSLFWNYIYGAVGGICFHGCGGEADFLDPVGMEVDFCGCMLPWRQIRCARLFPAQNWRFCEDWLGILAWPSAHGLIHGSIALACTYSPGWMLIAILMRSCGDASVSDGRGAAGGCLISVLWKSFVTRDANAWHSGSLPLPPQLAPGHSGPKSALRKYVTPEIHAWALRPKNSTPEICHSGYSRMATPAQKFQYSSGHSGLYKAQIMEITFNPKKNALRQKVLQQLYTVILHL
ncbi:hypothetical protein Nepgr_028340 [Nepenthes gracilis]|uniref:Uncharacterized protein n=1 Tax=Nepenthes gracilis TaxID=150966 RepID=A0AAD3TBT0_NEPGR|nr:hypothetical protein Nepgr_028340 [Nepenthes gracilis]